MPKMKSKSCVKKRFKISKLGKIMKRRCGARHKMENKSKSRKQNFRKDYVLRKTEADVIKKLLPYS